MVAPHLQAGFLQVDEATAALRFDNSELEALATEDSTDSDDEEVVGLKLRNHSEVVASARARTQRRGVFGPIDEQLAKLSLGSSPLRSPSRWGTTSVAAPNLHVSNSRSFFVPSNRACVHPSTSIRCLSCRFGPRPCTFSQGGTWHQLRQELCLDSSKCLLMGGSKAYMYLRNKHAAQPCAV